MKKRISLLLVALLILAAFTGCSGSNESAAPESKEPAEVISISIGHVNAPTEPIALACEYWAEKLEEISGGTMVMECYPSSQLGSMTDVYDMALANDAVIAYGHNGYLADLGATDLNAMYAPYLFKSWDDFEKIMDSDWMAEQKDIVENEIGLILVSDGWHYGVRHTLTKDPVNSLEDLKGMKIRTPTSTAQVVGYSLLGATPTPMNLSECYTALQQGTIDGLENPADVIYSGNFQEVGKYLALTGHFYNDANWAVGKGFFDSLTAEQQGWLLESGEMATEYFNELAEKTAEEAIEKMKDEGVTVTEIDLGDSEALTAAYYETDEFSNLTDGIYETMKEIING